MTACLPVPLHTGQCFSCEFGRQALSAIFVKCQAKGLSSLRTMLLLYGTGFVLVTQTHKRKNRCLHRQPPPNWNTGLVILILHALNIKVYNQLLRQCIAAKPSDPPNQLNISPLIGWGRIGAVGKINTVPGIYSRGVTWRDTTFL